MCLFYWFIDVCITNAFALHRKTHRDAREKGPPRHLEFRLDLVDQLLALAWRLEQPGNPVDVSTLLADEEDDRAVFNAARVSFGTTPRGHRPSYRRRADTLPPERFTGRHIPLRLPSSERHKCDFCGFVRATTVCSCGYYLCLTVERQCFSKFHDPAFTAEVAT